MKKLIYIIKILATLNLFPLSAYAGTQAADLERDSSQHFTMADSVSMSPTEDFSLEAWYKPESVAADANVIMARWADAGSDKSFQLYFNGTSFILSIRNAANGEESYTWAYVVGTGAWLWVGVYWDASASTAELFTGTEAACCTSAGTQTGTFTDMKDVATSVLIGRNATNYNFDGRLDNVRFWTDLRTGAEFDTDQCNDTPTVADNLSGNWLFEGSSGAELLDETANNNDLTNVNTATFATDTFTCVVAAAPATARPPQDILFFQ